MRRALWIATCSLALALCCATLACGGPPPPPPQPAQVSVNVMRGFAEPLAAAKTPQLVAIVDATAVMRERDASGVAHLEAARASAARWHDAISAETSVELRVLGGARGASCTSPSRVLAGDGSSRVVWRAALDGLSPAGDGSLAGAIFELASRLDSPDPTPLRVAAWSALRDPCGISLCEAARALAQRGGQLDLVVLGDAPVPECLVEIEAPPAKLPSAAPQRAVRFRVERLGPDPAVIGYSESGGLPVEFAPGNARIVVELEPPVVIERAFPAASRSVLEIVDFPALEPPARHWRWRGLEPAPPPAQAAR